MLKRPLKHLHLLQEKPRSRQWGQAARYFGRMTVGLRRRTAVGQHRQLSPVT